MSSPRQPQRPTRHAILAIALLSIGTLSACSSSVPATSATTLAASTTSPPVTQDPNRLPSPFQINQRIGLGDRWQMVVTSATRSGNAFAVAVDVINTGTDTATFGGTPGLFTAMDAYANVPQQPSATVAPIVIAAGATAKLRLQFSGIAPTAKHPVLFFHGHLLPGHIDATVWFSL